MSYTNEKTNLPALPAIFTGRDLPRVAVWASNKLQSFRSETVAASKDCPAYTVRAWTFEGKMPRRSKSWFDNFKSADGRREYSIGLVIHGGQYRGQLQTMLLTFNEYEYTEKSAVSA